MSKCHPSTDESVPLELKGGLRRARETSRAGGVVLGLGLFQN